MDAVAAASFALALAGFAIALYFTLVTYRWISPDSPWVPPLCRMDEGTCAKVVDTKEARLLGIPNSVVALPFYAFVALEALLGTPHPRALLVACAAAALMSPVLAALLIYRLRIACVLCFAGHAINMLLFVDAISKAT